MFPAIILASQGCFEGVIDKATLLTHIVLLFADVDPLNHPTNTTKDPY
ncbi:MAG: hypothetical protein QW059_06835 [Nitrososphaerota archaeon]